MENFSIRSPYSMEILPLIELIYVKKRKIYIYVYMFESYM
jgi:hypothetical protein